MRSLLLILLLPALSFAQIPHTFTNGDIADAEKINENFETLRQLFSESLRPLNEPESAESAGRSTQPAERFEVDCTEDDQALKNAIAGGHSAITVLAGTCDANTDDIDINGRRLGIVGVETNGVKPVLDTNGGRFNSSASLIGLKNLVLRGSVRTAVGFLGLTNVDVDCSSITNPLEHGIWVYGSQLYFIGSSLSGCGGMQVAFNGIVYAAASEVLTVVDAGRGLNLFQGARVWSEGTSWQTAGNDLMTIGTGSEVTILGSPTVLSGDIEVEASGLLSVFEGGGACPVEEPDGAISLAFTSLLNWPNRCDSRYSVSCKDALQLMGYSDGLTCR